jgi:hypothetical protein
VSVAVAETKIVSRGRETKTKREAMVRYIYAIQVLGLQTVDQPSRWSTSVKPLTWLPSVPIKTLRDLRSCISK